MFLQIYRELDSCLYQQGSRKRIRTNFHLFIMLCAQFVIYDRPEPLKATYSDFKVLVINDWDEFLKEMLQLCFYQFALE